MLTGVDSGPASHLVIVDDFNIECSEAFLGPLEAEAPLFIDANAVLTFAIPG